MELKEQLEALAIKLEGKSKEEVRSSIEAFTVENTKSIEAATDAVKSELLKEIEILKDNAVELQKHSDALDIKLQEQKKGEVNSQDAVKSLITDNFEEIKAVRKGQGVQVKAVGDMTLGASLTGDQPRDYNFDVVSVPSPLVNVSDLVGSRNISGGTYTYVRVAKGEGSISTQTEGSSKSQIDYDYTMVDVTTDFIAGFARYSKKMANNLPFLESSLPVELRRDYVEAENAAFNTVLATDATASTEVITGQNKVEMLIQEIATLEGSNYMVNAITVTPADYWDILITEKSTGAGYGLPGVVTFDGGQLRINGIPVLKATWLAANKYFVGDWSRINKINTEGLSLNFSEEDSDNFVKNNITARIEAQTALAVEQPAAIIYGDFTAV